MDFRNSPMRGTAAYGVKVCPTLMAVHASRRREFGLQGPGTALRPDYERIMTMHRLGHGRRAWHSSQPANWASLSGCISNAHGSGLNNRRSFYSRQGSPHYPCWEAPFCGRGSPVWPALCCVCGRPSPVWTRGTPGFDWETSKPRRRMEPLGLAPPLPPDDDTRAAVAGTILWDVVGAQPLFAGYTLCVCLKCRLWRRDTGAFDHLHREESLYLSAARTSRHMDRGVMDGAATERAATWRASGSAFQRHRSVHYPCCEASFCGRGSPACPALCCVCGRPSPVWTRGTPGFDWDTSKPRHRIEPPGRASPSPLDDEMAAAVAGTIFIWALLGKLIETGDLVAGGIYWCGNAVLC